MMRLIWIAPCAVLFVLLTGDLSAKNWAFGSVLGAALVPLFPRSADLSSFAALLRLASLPWFLVGAAKQIIEGAITVGLGLLTRRRRDAGVVVAVENPTRTHASAHVLSLVFTASPGTVVLRFDESRDAFIVHAFDERIAASAPQSIHGFYRRFQRWTFP